MTLDEFEAKMNAHHEVEGYQYRAVGSSPFEYWSFLDSTLGSEIIYLSEHIDYVHERTSAEILISPKGMELLTLVLANELLEKLEQEQTDA